eukprot:SAG22_NODE_739_length_7523_cov_6.844558_2_plen_79_part_00
MLGIVLTPILLSAVYVPAGTKLTAIKNKLRVNILAKQAMCKTKPQFNRFVPQVPSPPWQQAAGSRQQAVAVGQPDAVH